MKNKKMEVLQMTTTKIAEIKALLENEANGKYVTFYNTVEDYNQERGLNTVEQGYEDIIERQEDGDEITLGDMSESFLVIDESGSSEFRVYKKSTVETKEASYFA